MAAGDPFLDDLGLEGTDAMHAHACLAAAVLVCTVGVTQGAPAGVAVDDFAKPEPTGWQISGSPEYHRGGFGAAGVSIVPEAVDGLPALRAPIRIAAGAKTPAVWLTRKLDTLPGLQRWEKLTFRFKLSTTAGLASRNGLVCRLRTSSAAFTDLPFAEPATVRPGEWQEATVRFDRFAEPRNLYNTYFEPLIELTFRFGAAEGQAYDGEFQVAALTLHPKAADEPYTPQVTARPTGALRRALLITNSAASYAFVRETLEATQVAVDRCRFRGLHFPLFDFPASREALFAYDLVVLVDVDPYVLTRPQVEWLCDYAASGGGLLFVAGPNTFGSAKLFARPLADLLPVRFSAGQSAVAVSAVTEAPGAHPITAGLRLPLLAAGRAQPLQLTEAATPLLASAGGLPPGWGLYSGGTPGDGALAGSSEAHSGRRSVMLETRQFYKDPATGNPKMLSLKLMQGDSDGYGGARAYVATPGAEYRVAFWLKGDVPEVKVSVTAWTTEAAKPADRQPLRTSLPAIRPTSAWQRFEGTFQLPAAARRFALAFEVSGTPARFPLGSRLWVDDVELALAAGGPNLAANPGGEDDTALPVLAVASVQRGRVGILNAFPDVSGDVASALCCSGEYRTLVARLCQWLAGQEPTAQSLAGYAPETATFAATPAPDPARFFPIISWLGTEGGGHLLDERALRERVDDLWAHGFNTVAINGLRHLSASPTSNRARLLDYAARYAQSRGMAVTFEYEHLTNLSPTRPPTPCVFAPAYREELARGLAARFEVVRRYERAWSIKIIDEPTASDATLDYCDLCRAEFQKRYGRPLRHRAEIPADDLEGHRQLSQFVADYVASGYQAIRQAAAEAHLPARLLLTYMSPGFGYSDPRSSLEDVLGWSRAADVIDFDVYPYFYPTSQNIRMLQAHFCFAVQRAVAEHLGKPAGFYVELDDRNYPFQVNPVEASAECAWTAVGQGCRYLNSFINTAFGTGTGARPERWDHLGRELVRIRAAGPDLARLHKAPAALALYFPAAQWFSGGARVAPHYTYQLLLRAFGECDIAHEQIALERGNFGSAKALVLVGTTVIPDPAVALLAGFLASGGFILCDETARLPAALEGQPRVIRLAGNLEKRFAEAAEGPVPAARAALMAEVRAALAQTGLQAEACADHEEVETDVLTGDGMTVLIAVNHAAAPVETAVRLRGRAEPLRLSLAARNGLLTRLAP